MASMIPEMNGSWEDNALILPANPASTMLCE